ncbi:MAG: cell surface protein, partial [Pirellula sp.]
MLLCIIGCYTLDLLAHSAIAAPACIVEDASEASRPISLVNDVVPVLTKSGCNAGTCHAKAGNGQNGFQLSLLGFEPKEDFSHLVLEGRGRRLSLAAPEQSLLLLKATGTVPHGGGAKIPVDSDRYRTLLE